MADFSNQYKTWNEAVVNNWVRVGFNFKKTVPAVNWAKEEAEGKYLLSGNDIRFELESDAVLFALRFR